MVNAFETFVRLAHPSPLFVPSLCCVTNVCLPSVKVNSFVAELYTAGVVDRYTLY